MGELLIKLGDERLIKQISDLARAHQNTPESEAENLLRKAVASKHSNNKRAQIAQNISGMTPANRHQTDSTVLVREDRDR